VSNCGDLASDSGSVSVPESEGAPYNRGMLEVVRDILVNRLDDLLAFVRTIRARLTS
jgi:hypothetical protein